ADGPSGFTDQNGVPQADRIQQFLVFFSDGRPNVFRDVFRNKNAIVDALVRVGGGNCDPGDNNQVYQYLMSPVTGNDMAVVARPTGDGLLPSRCGANTVTTRWFVLD